MTLTEKSLRFLDSEIKTRKEQKEYLSDVQGEHRENHSKGRELFLKLSEEIEVLEHLKEKMVWVQSWKTSTPVSIESNDHH